MAKEQPGLCYSEAADPAAAIVQFTPVTLGATGLLTTTAALGCDGFAQMPAAIGVGETIRVMKTGITFAIADAAGVTRGDRLEVGAGGAVSTLAAGVEVGVALETVAATGRVSVLLS